MIGTLTVDGWAFTFGTAAPPDPLLAVPNVTAHPSTATVPTSYYLLWHYNYLCLLKCYMKKSIVIYINEVLWLCQAGASVMSGGRSGIDSGYSKVVQNVLHSAVQQSLSEGGESCVCHICSAQLKNPTTLQSHIRGAHLAIKAYRCNICGESFQWSMQVARHKKRVHGSDGNQLLIYQWPRMRPPISVT